MVQQGAGVAEAVAAVGAAEDRVGEISHSWYVPVGAAGVTTAMRSTRIQARAIRRCGVLLK
jgi:hypothetical protein